ncbi:MAG: cryptochrome/photolyase family protein [Kiloniellales bacterium]
MSASSPAPTLVWFRQDLRLSDNPALAAAVARGGPVVPFYLLDDETPGSWTMGGASRWWLHHSLQSLSADLAAKGARLILRRGAAAEAIPTVAEEIGAATVLWNRCYEPWAVPRDTALKERLKAAGLAVDSFSASLLQEPWTVQTGAGKPYTVFSPFWRAIRDRDVPRPLATPGEMASPEGIASDRLEDWQLLPQRPDWAGGLRDSWTPGEQAAQERLADFLDERVDLYAEERNRPDIDGTSGLSPYLHWGEISPRQIWHATHHRLSAEGAASKGAWSFLSEVGWRDFSYHLLFHWPSLMDETWKENFKAFPWRENPDGLRAWCRGQTGFPIVDAGMRQLWHTGWMHNRVRMIVGSFLIKDLMIHWQEGERWFWDTLVDADAASNGASWQWVAGCGADAAPYFRIFNPMTQGEKFDPSGDYTRKWVPEVAELPDRYLHRPWEAPEEVLAKAGVRLGETYPEPIVDHSVARQAALAAFENIKKGAA